MALQTLGLRQPERREAVEPATRDTTAPIFNAGYWEAFATGNSSEAGETVNDATAMQISTVFSCIRILAESISSLPLKLYKVTNQGRTQDLANPLHFLLSIAPNDEVTSFTLIETLVAHIALTGNGYLQIERAGDGTPLGLWNLQPRLTEPFRLPTGALAYRTTDGEKPGQSRVLPAKDVCHIPLTTWDSVCGLSPIQQCRRALGLSIASEKFASRLFTNSAVPQLALTIADKVKPEDKVKIRGDWTALQTGHNQHKIAVLDQGMKIEKLSLTNDEAQFLELRQFTRADIASIFRVPAHMVGELQKLSNANTESMNTAFYLDGLRPYMGRIEAEFTKKLLPREKGKVSDLEVRFDPSERLRSDFDSQIKGAVAARQWGWLTANEVRKNFGLNEGGPELDRFIVPLNMQDSEHLLDPPEDNKVVPNGNE